jgi:hypothetical protein
MLQIVVAMALLWDVMGSSMLAGFLSILLVLHPLVLC